jgi:hypothetical protein
MSAPAGPDFEIACPDPMNRPVPIVPPELSQEGYNKTKASIPMAIICKCRLLSFLLSSGPLVTSFFSASRLECSLRFPTEGFFSCTGTFFPSTPLATPIEESDRLILQNGYQIPQTRPQNQTRTGEEPPETILDKYLLYNEIERQK